MFYVSSLHNLQLYYANEESRVKSQTKGSHLQQWYTLIKCYSVGAWEYLVLTGEIKGWQKSCRAVNWEGSVSVKKKKTKMETDWDSVPLFIAWVAFLK